MKPIKTRIDTMISKLIFAIFFGAILGLLLGLYTYLTPSSSLLKKSIIQTPVAIGGPFILVDVTGKVRTNKDFIGKPMLIYFGFTHCPDICPTGLQTLTLTLNNLGKLSSNIAPVFITIDPERDTPQKLAAYLQSFHPDIQGLSGSTEQVQNIVKSYRVYTKKIDDPNKTNEYFFDHSSFFYLMDKRGNYVKHFPSSITVEKLTSEVTSYLTNPDAT